MTGFMAKVGAHDLTDMLQTKRPHGSAIEADWVKRFIDPMGGYRDGFGNRIIRVGGAPVLWSCHTDTVHHKAGQQKIKVDKKTGIITVGAKSNCLGADDGAGVWIMLEMIDAGIEGVYVFHRGEECGGLGSQHITNDEPGPLEGIKYAIAFDRRGTGDVITHQAGGRCCSDTFANALAGQLGGDYRPSDRGIFTDTANYTYDIGECTNISVGYYDEHTNRESLDSGFLFALRDKLLRLDVGALPVERDPGQDDPDEPDDFDMWMDFKPDFDRNVKLVTGSYRQHGAADMTDLEALCYENPETAADLLRENGIGPDAFLQRLYDYGRA